MEVWDCGEIRDWCWSYCSPGIGCLSSETSPVCETTVTHGDLSPHHVRTKLAGFQLVLDIGEATHAVKILWKKITSSILVKIMSTLCVCGGRRNPTPCACTHTMPACIHVCLSVWVCECLCMWRPEVSVHQLLSTLFLDRSCTGLELAFGWTGW